MTKETVLGTVRGVESLPKKGQQVLVNSPYQCIVILWTDRKNDRGERLYNVGHFDGTGKEPSFYNM
jgi:hypothetical protein